jgi:thiazole synthase ThiGH ThiG subunit
VVGLLWPAQTEIVTVPLTLVQSISAGGIGILASAAESRATQTPGQAGAEQVSEPTEVVIAREAADFGQRWSVSGSN